MIFQPATPIHYRSVLYRLVRLVNDAQEWCLSLRGGTSWKEKERTPAKRFQPVLNDGRAIGFRYNDPLHSFYFSCLLFFFYLSLSLPSSLLSLLLFWSIIIITTKTRRRTMTPTMSSSSSSTKDEREDSYQCLTARNGRGCGDGDGEQQRRRQRLTKREGCESGNFMDRVQSWLASTILLPQFALSFCIPSPKHRPVIFLIWRNIFNWHTIPFRRRRRKGKKLAR